MKRLAIVGWPVEHSMSPPMHEAAFQAAGVSGSYERVAVEPDDFEVFIRTAKETGEYDGFNITVPHKISALRVVEGLDEHASVIGAVNTIVLAHGSAMGHNTDARGLLRSLQEKVEISESSYVVLGAGGAARAAVVALAEGGAAEVRVCARREEQAAQLVESFSGSLAPDLIASAWDDRLTLAFERASGVVQATSGSLGDGAARFAQTVPVEKLPEGSWVADLVYNPRITPLLAKAEARGLPIVDGTGMLLYQGAVAFELWFGVSAPIRQMREALEKQLAG